jgi:hypothetical protein
MNSVAGNANLNVHSFLLALESWRAAKGHLPKKIYWQVDGGSENANKNVLAFCEYLVAKTPIEEIVLTRLPVGHTHEDIDGRFGKIWQHCRLQTILTPEEYKQKLKVNHIIFYIYIYKKMYIKYNVYYLYILGVLS